LNESLYGSLGILFNLGILSLAWGLNRLIKQFFDILKRILVHRVYLSHINDDKIDDTASHGYISVLIPGVVDTSLHLLCLFQSLSDLGALDPRDCEVLDEFIIIENVGRVLFSQLI